MALFFEILPLNDELQVLFGIHTGVQKLSHD